MNARRRRQLTLFGEIGGAALVTFALLITLSEFGLHVYASLLRRAYNVSWTMLLVALVMGFTGFYVLNPRGAKDGGKFIVDNAIRVVQVLRLGRRKKDPSIVTVEDSMGHTAEIAVPTLVSDDDAAQTPDTHQRRSTDSPGADHGTRD